MKKIFDAYAVLCWMQGEDGSLYIEKLLERAESKSVEILISAINIGEVYYILKKSRKGDKADSFLLDARGGGFPWQIMPATNGRVWEAAALKSRHRVSYADAFALALAIEFNAPLVTRDPEIVHASESGLFMIDGMETGLS
jgi:predicted nucleic acid-binding protein